MKPASESVSKPGAPKSELRARFISRRDALSESLREARGLEIGRRLRRLKLYRNAGTVMFYVTHRSEVPTESMIVRALKDGKNVVVPVTDPGSRSLSACRILSPEKDLTPGTYGVREPEAGRRSAVGPEKIDVVLVPGLVFDTSGQRLGYGKGYYDSWLQRFARERRIGLAYRFQVVSALPCEAHDVPVGTIITEKAIIRTGSIKRTTGGTAT